jgi:DNA-binding transcriptional ArsR family regulator
VQVWEALADPTRREIVQRLAAGEATAGALAAAFDIARPGVSRHLRVLREAEVVDVRQDAQRRIYSLRPDVLAGVEDWCADVRRFWSQHLDALDTEIARGKRSRHEHQRKNQEKS